MAGSTVVVSVLANTSQFTSAFRKAGDDASLLTRGLGTVAKGAGIAVGAIGAVAAAVGALALKGGFDRALAIQDSEQKLKGLGYSAAQVASVMDSALQSVKGTAYGLGDASKAAATLVASGVQQGDQLTATLKSVADVAAVSGRSITDVGVIFGSVAALGKLQGQDMRQLLMAGVPVLDLLSKSMGVTQQRAQEMVTAGKVSFADFEKAMQGLSGVALATGQTFRGSLANIGAALSRLGVLFAGPIVAGAPPLFNAIAGAVDKITEALKPLGEVLSAKIGAAFASLGNWISGLDIAGLAAQFSALFDAGSQIAQLASFFSPLGLVVKVLQPLLPQLANSFSILGQTLMGALQPVLPTIVAALQTLVEVFSGALAAVLPPVLTLVTSLASALGGVLAGVLPVIVNLLSTVANVLAAVVPAIAPLVAAVTGILSTALTGIVPIITTVAQVVGGVLTTALQAAAPLLTMLAGFVTEVLNAVAPLVPVVLSLLAAFMPLIQTIGQLIGTILPPLVQIISALLQPILQLISPLLQLIGPILQPLIDLIAGLAGVLTGILQTAITVITALLSGDFTGAAEAMHDGFNNAVNGILGIIPGFVDSIRNALSAVVGFFGDLGSKILAAIGDAGSWLLNMGSQMIQGLINGIGNAAGKVRDALGGVINGAIDWARGLLGIHSPSRVFSGIGLNVIKGLETGLTGPNRLSSIMSGLASDLTDSFAVDLAMPSTQDATGTGVRVAPQHVTNVSVVQNNPVTRDPLKQLRTDSENLVYGVWA